MPILNKAAAAAISEQNESPASIAKAPLITSKIDNTSPIVEFLEGKNCLTGVRISCIHETKLSIELPKL